MKNIRPSTTRGSVIVMVTFAILLLFAAVGLTVDIGWAYFTRRTAQVAADAAAQAGALEAMKQANNDKNFDNIKPDVVKAHAVEYAKLNKFEADGDRYFVDITQGKGIPPASFAPLDQMEILYWVQARVAKRLSTWFWGVPGPGSDLNSGAVAVAAVVLGPLEGSIILLNQTCDKNGTDCSPDLVDFGGANKPGTNLFISGGSTIETEGGIIINSSANGDLRTNGNYAVEFNGNSGWVRSPYMMIAQDGSSYAGAVNPAAITQVQDLAGNPQAPISGPQIDDPTLSINFGKQPRVSTVAELALAVNPLLPTVYGAAGAFGGSAGNPAILSPGTYVGITYVAGVPQPNTNGVRITGDVQFLPGNYVFLGGLDIQGAPVTFGEGVYVMAGAQPKANGTAGLVFNVTANSKLLDTGSTKGELFLFTDTEYGTAASDVYPILLNPADSYSIQPKDPMGANFGPQSPPVPFAAMSALEFGTVDMQAGQTNKADVDLHGLQNRTPCVEGACGSAAAELYLYQPILMWQDRLNNLYENSKLAGRAAKVIAQAGTLQGLHGTVYQPQGSLFEVQGSNSQTGEAKIITGALHSAGGNSLKLVPTVDPLLVTTVRLVR